ncbi:hypothetical protein GOP47_0024150 [Adiantum capillus-veneris]|uniref:NodB homology domain-containing protein n=2 Tax=Adiantum capillus-veneris TaxID=13818 RepID=A0A9D4Z5A2_ADICA|nr:hypothetical protein GOP47_0024150 [Adiantum capillus-veneris]
MNNFAVAGLATATAIVALPVVAAVVSGFSLAMQPKWAVRCAQKRWPNVLFFQPTRDPVVALTIDDGPHDDITPEILEILKENDCKATWFIIGSNMDRCPEIVRQIYSEGHEVGNHTMHDVASWRLPLEEFEEQLLSVDRRLNDLYFEDNHDRKIKWFRPGHGFFTEKMLHVAERHGYRTALGSLFPLDTLFTSQGENIAKYLLWRVHYGDIIILHDRAPQRLQTAKALRILLPKLRERGFSVVTLSELLKLQKGS